MRTLLLSLGLAAACLSPVSAWAQATRPLTLEQALDQALLHSPRLAAARQAVEAAQGAARQAGLWRNPTLNATVEDPRRDTRTTAITLDIPLELGGQRAARLRAAAQAVDLASAELSQTRADVRADVIRTFFTLRIAQERALLARDSAELAGRAAHAAAQRVAAGKVSPVEATRAQIDEAQAQLEQAEATAELAMARVALASALGDTTTSIQEVQGDLNALPPLPDLSQLEALLDASPALQIGRLEAARRLALVEVERRKRVPELTLNLGAQRDAATGRTQAVVGLSWPLPVFDRNQGAVLEARRRAEQADDERRATHLRLRAELQEAAQRLALAHHSLALLQDTVLPSARQAYEAASQGFNAGKFGFLEVLDAQRSLLQARARYLHTQAAAYQAAATMDRITGR